MLKSYGKLLIIVIGMVSCLYVSATSVNKGEEVVQRRLGQIIVEDDRAKYEHLLSKSAYLRKEIANLSRLLPDERASDRIKEFNSQLQQSIRDTLEISQQSSKSRAQGFAAERAVERARKRDAVRHLAEEKKRREEEDFNYIQNMRKMNLVDNTVADLQSRAVFHGLDSFGTQRVNDMLNEYRRMEADYIFNGTNVQAAHAQKRFIEKFIGDSQAIEITNKQRQRELLDRTIQELAARGVSFMCRPEMKVLDDMLAVLRDYGFKLIELSNSKQTSGSLTEQIAATQKATQAQKLSIEKYIGTTKTTSKCATSKRYFQSRGSSS